MNCIFCQVVEKKINASFLYEDEEVVAFRDIAPQSPEHILIIPKKHLSSLNQSQEEDLPLLGRLLKTAQLLARDLEQAEAGYRLVINTGLNGGQTVEHLHLHLLAGRPMTWPPG